MLWQIWTFWRSNWHSEEVPLWHTLFQPGWSDALSAATWAIHNPSHSAARRQVTATGIVLHLCTSQSRFIALSSACWGGWVWRKDTEGYITVQMYNIKHFCYAACNNHKSALLIKISYFYHAACMQGCVSHERNVCLSVKRVNCEKTKETYAKIFVPCESLSSCFLTGIMVGGGWPLLPEILSETDPVGSKMPIFNRYLPVAPQL